MYVFKQQEEFIKLKYILDTHERNARGSACAPNSASCSSIIVSSTDTAMQSNKETKFDYGDAPRKNSDFVMTCTNVSMIDACLHDIGVVVDNVERRQTRAEHDREIVCRHFCLVRLRRDVMQERAEQIQRAQMFASGTHDPEAFDAWHLPAAGRPFRRR